MTDLPAGIAFLFYLSACPAGWHAPQMSQTNAGECVGPINGVQACAARSQLPYPIAPGSPIWCVKDGTK